MAEWATEAEVESCALVGDMERIDGKWVTIATRPGRLSGGKPSRTIKVVSQYQE